MRITAAVTIVMAAILSGDGNSAAANDGSGGQRRSRAFAGPGRLRAEDFAVSSGLFLVMEKVFLRMKGVMRTMVLLVMKILAR